MKAPDGLQVDLGPAAADRSSVEATITVDAGALKQDALDEMAKDLRTLAVQVQAGNPKALEIVGHLGEAVQKAARTPRPGMNRAARRRVARARR